MIRYTQRGAGRPQLGDPVAAELVSLPGRQQLQLGHVYLALFPERAGHEGDSRSVRRVSGHGGACADRFVVGVGVYEQNAPEHRPTIAMLRIPAREALQGGYHAAYGG